jgi:hypothetical protein
MPNMHNIDDLIAQLQEARAKGFSELVIVGPPDAGDAEYSIVSLDPWDVGPVPGVLTMTVTSDEN